MDPEITSTAEKPSITAIIAQIAQERPELFANQGKPGDVGPWDRQKTLD